MKGVQLEKDQEEPAQMDIMDQIFQMMSVKEVVVP